MKKSKNYLMWWRKEILSKQYFLPIYKKINKGVKR